MITIHKYPLETADVVRVPMPAGAEILCVREQHGQICLWAKVSTDEAIVNRTLFMFGTGHSLDVLETVAVSSKNVMRVGYSRPKYVGTVFEAGGHLVWHIYDAGEQT